MTGRVARVAFVLGIATTILLLAGRAAITVRDADLSDFRCFYEAGRLVRLGEDPYDRATWAAATITDPGRIPPCARTFIYPLWTGMAMAPISVLPEGAALAAWEIVLLGATVSGVALLARIWPLFGGARLLLVAVLSSQPMFSAIANAQFGPILFLGLASLAFALERRRVRAAAGAWCLLLIKPHITALVLVGALAARSRRFVLYAIAGALFILVASLALIPSWPADLIRENVGEQQLLVDRDLSTLWSLASVVGLPSLVGAIAAVITLVAFVAALPRRALAPRELVAVLTAASFLLTPYVRAHDEVALAVCWAAALACASAADRSLRRWLVAAVIGTGTVLPWTLTLLSLAGVPLASYVLITVATAALTAYALRRLGPLTAAQPLG